MNSIPSLAHRKQSNLTIADIPDGTTSIGDAAFSLCPHLKQVAIPASVEHIGVAAFCGTGLETVTFNGVPTEIEASLFIACKQLRVIIVPKGTKAKFDVMLPAYAHLIKENAVANNRIPVTSKPPAPISKARPTGVQTVIPFAEVNDAPAVATKQQNANVPLGYAKRSKLTYNFHDFAWAKGDRFQISDLLTGNVVLNDSISFQFRRKYLFVFMKSHVVASISPGKEYSIPANTAYFKRKYEEKYGSRKIRIFLFITNDGTTAIFLDEVVYNRISSNSIIVSSAL